MSAIEDAEAVGAFLRGVDRAGVNVALRRAYRVRFNRATEVQAASRRECIVVGLPGSARRPGAGLQQFDYQNAEQWEREHPDMVLAE
jgi:hypothetical protein